jgi:hypothetical protein
MSKPKEAISIEKLTLFSEYLDDLKLSIDLQIANAKAVEMESVMIEGWPTLARGFQFILDQMQGFVGSASNVHQLDGRDLLMPGQTYAPTRKVYVSKKEKKLVEEMAEELAEIRDSKIERVKAGRKKKSN